MRIFPSEQLTAFAFRKRPKASAAATGEFGKPIILQFEKPLMLVGQQNFSWLGFPDRTPEIKQEALLFTVILNPLPPNANQPAVRGSHPQIFLSINEKRPHLHRR